MKYYSIVLFVFMFNLALGLLNTSAAFPTEIQKGNPTLADDWINNTIDIGKRNLTSTSVSQGNDFLNAVGDFAFGVNVFFNAFFQATIFVPDLFQKVLPDSPEATQMAFYLSAMVYMIYAGAAVQFIANRSFKSQD